MQEAVKHFVNSFSVNGKIREGAWISIVPFSSRISFGMERTSWLVPYRGNPAVPRRWTQPASTYNSGSFRISYWIDGVTALAYNTASKNEYWMGCIEPRADVETNDTGAIGLWGATDAPPAVSGFVPMDDNKITVGNNAGKISGDSFCPSPIVPLTNDLDTLLKTAEGMTSQGSTRLDAGIAGGFYALSPKWRGLWGTAGKPAAASENVRKIVVFMTDGAMNTQNAPDSKNPRHNDWLCKKNRNDSLQHGRKQSVLGDMLERQKVKYRNIYDCL